MAFSKKSKSSKLLSRFGGSWRAGGPIPGFDNSPRPILSFILRVLDGCHESMVRDHLAFFWAYDFSAQTPAIAHFLSVIDERPELFQVAVRSMVETTREMIDMWVESGKSGTDRLVDTPADRNVEDILPGRSYSLFHLIDTVFFRNTPRYLGMTREGTVNHWETFPKFDTESLGWGFEAALKQYGQLWAGFHVAGLLDSKYARQIARCDSCQTYFAYERARLRTVKSGVFCSACQSRGSIFRTLKSRSRRLDTASGALIEWESKPRRADQKDWIWQQVNKAHGTMFGRRWVSQNWEEIIKRTEARRNAKG